MFFITGLPRSRTAWFSAFMTASGFPCLHEGVNGCKTIKEYKRKVSHISDSNTAFGMLSIDIDRPTLIIHRDARHDSEEMKSASQRLSGISGMHVNFDDIDNKINDIFLYLTGVEVDLSVYNIFRMLNIQSMTDIDIESARALLNDAD
jgi:hypothetical protein